MLSEIPLYYFDSGDSMNYEITGRTKLTALLGSPVAHSISPQMHNESFRQLGLDYVYLAFDITPGQLKETFLGLKALDIQGFNLTMPLKTEIIPYLDELTPAARLAKAVNTVYRQNSRFIGHTTDGIGYMRSISDAGHDIIGKKMTLLGAGGAASAICVQAALDGVQAIDVFKRNNASFQEAARFCERVAVETGCPIRLFDLADTRQLSHSIAESAILINATNVGMAPDIHCSPLSDTSSLHPNLLVSDIIYNPRQTLLMKQAEEVGCKCIGGLYMLLFQGAEAFRCWTGKDMPVEHIRKKFFTDERTN